MCWMASTARQNLMSDLSSLALSLIGIVFLFNALFGLIIYTPMSCCGRPCNVRYLAGNWVDLIGQFILLGSLYLFDFLMDWKFPTNASWGK
jgi:hypothetical protein